MINKYILDYLDENNYKKLERNLREYNIHAYKKLMFDIYPNLRNGIFNGELVSINRHKFTEDYKIYIESSDLFERKYGKVYLYYTISKLDHGITLNNLDPSNILFVNNKYELTDYNGIMIDKDNIESEKFRIDLLCLLDSVE